ncbi:MAG: phospho-N-acetylmuramoyl-pentapeptide-transferase [Christensenellaceae bacterium]|jgi:phospho-N-acetylmuramoyl-pentapeptide-transferase|nr:phospho-N-acetylmuramoyl-pentapeptide-transferase [Christensenellaceae bacterium]
MTNFIFVFLFGFVLCAGLTPLVIILSRRLKFGQNILHYVESHTAKQGTPTMGGIAFVLSTVLASLFFINTNYSFGFLILALGLGFGVLGFLDDFIKIRFKRNMGLRAYQKIIGQASLAIIAALFVYLNPNIENSVILPFSNTSIELGFFVVPLIVFVFLALTNSVNLTDGLDGLASGVSLMYLLGFAFITYFYIGTGLTHTMNSDVILISLALVGSLFAFLMFNCYPAKIFMGDTGSLAIGAFLASLACFNGMMLYVPILGFMFVLSSISVIIQVLHFKRTKRRVFLMTPLHHHFEKKGVHESRIVAIYIVITAVIALFCLLLLGGI